MAEPQSTESEEEFTIDEFICMVENELEDFRAFWEAESRKGENDFPYRMEENNWFEQFIIHLNRHKE